MVNILQNMVKVVFIKRNGSFKESSIKLKSIDMLYKKCLFSSNKNFSKRHTWSMNSAYYSIFSKSSGKSGNENKYDLPPPIDNDLYFGNMVLVKHNNQDLKKLDELNDLTITEWTEVYNQLFGGFENIEESEEKGRRNNPENLTKEGYDKTDGFIVDDSISESNYSEKSEEEYNSDDEDYHDEDSEEHSGKDSEEDSEEYSEEYSEEKRNIMIKII